MENKQYYFIDYIDGELTDKEFEILNSFSFNLIPTRNRNRQYIGDCMIELNQLNYGIKRYDISNDEELENELLECAELDGLSYEEKNRIINLFIVAIENFENEVIE